MSYFLTDRIEQSLCDEDGADTIDFSEKETVTVEDDGITEFFDTDQFYTFEATVAKPLVQKYVIDEEIVRLKKTEEELTKATWQIDTLPWTRTHPDAKEVEYTDQIRGFWRSPSYDDGQKAVGYLPANDEEMISFVAENPAVSIGFTPQIEWTVNDDVGYEGIQREMVYDHIASVVHGRCSREDGCGLMADEQYNHNHIRTSSTEEVASDVPCCTRNEITPLDEAAEKRLSTIADDGAATNSTTDTTMCDDNPFDGVVDGMSVEAVRRRNDSVDAKLTELNEEVESLTDETDSLEATIDEKDERIESLESTIDEKDERIDSLEEEVISYVDGAFADAVDELTSLTDKWAEEDLQSQYDDAEGVEAKRAVVDDVEEKIDLVEDLSTSVTTVGDSGADDDGGDDDDVVEAVADAKTAKGTFDLRGDA